MPNYNITIDSKFDPYSFEDYLKPLAMLQEQHNQAADAYATALANSAGLYDVLADSARVNAEDAEAAKYVNDYENSLNALANDLATNGLNRTNRRGVYETKAKTGYIEKLKKAIDNRNTFIAQQNELLAKDPTRRISDYAYNHGITRFLNPDFTYGTFSEADIQKQVEDTVKYLAKSTYLRDPDNPQFKHIAGLTKLMQESTGARPEEIDAAMQAIMSGQPLDEKQSKIAQMLYNDARDIATQHLGNWNWDDDAKKAAYVAASKGLYSALGTEENKIFNIDEPRATGSGSGTVEDPETQRFNLVSFVSGASKPNVRGRDKKVRRNTKQILDFVNGNSNVLMFNQHNVNLLNDAFEQYLNDENGMKNATDKEKQNARTLFHTAMQDAYAVQQEHAQNHKNVDQGARAAQGYYSNYTPKDKEFYNGLELGNQLKSDTKNALKSIVANFDTYLNNTGVLSDAFQYAGKSNEDIRNAVEENLRATSGTTQIQKFSGLNSSGQMKENEYLSAREIKNFNKALNDENNTLSMEFLVAPNTNGEDQLWELVTITEKNGETTTYRLPSDKNISVNIDALKAYTNARQEFEVWDDDDDYKSAFSKAMRGDELTYDEQIALEAHNYWDNEARRLYKLAPQVVANHRMYEAKNRIQNNSSNIIKG